MAKVLCSICGGWIGAGEPVMQQGGGQYAHRFRNTCEYVLKQITKHDEAFLKEMGVAPTEGE